MIYPDFFPVDFNFDKVVLEQPGWLWLVPAYICIFVVIKILKRKGKLTETSEPASLSTLSNKNQLYLYHPLANLIQVNVPAPEINIRRNFLYFIIFSLIIISLAQPVYIGKKLPDPPREKDIVFIVDTSVSMILRDYVLDGERIDRMNLLKAVLDNFIQGLKGERMSVIVFGDNAYTLVPLTSDQVLLRNMLTRIQATMAGRFNAIGEAIALAIKQARESQDDTGKVSRKRILVLLTDSDQPTGKVDPVVAAEIARENNLPIYTIAIGSTNPGAEEVRKGGLLYAPVDLDLLEKISGTTGAKSYHATDTMSLSQAVKEIDRLGSNKVKVEPVYYRQNFYYWFLILAFSLFITAQLTEFFKIQILRGIKNQ